MPRVDDGTVSDVAAFVMEHGALADELLFGDSELPGLTAAELEAIERVWDHLEETWVGILLAGREALWKLAGGRSSLGRSLRTSPARRPTVWGRGGVEMPLVIGRSWKASCIIELSVWSPNPREALRVLVWTQAAYRDIARDAVRGSRGVQWSGRSHWMDLGTPVAGHRYDDLGRRAAEALWSIAEPIGSAVLGAERTK